MKIAKLSVILGLIAMVMSFALAEIYSITAPEIARQLAEKTQKALQTVLPETKTGIIEEIKHDDGKVNYYIGYSDAEKKNLILKADYPGDLPRLYGDLHAFQEILENLLDNAVRYTSGGGSIRVNAAVKDNEIVVSVSDSGIGIPKVEQERVFERFYRADAARSRESGGTGLGLSIVKHLVEAQGGRVTVESEVGRGSTFRVILPIRRKS